MRQSSHVVRTLPALLGAALLLVGGSHETAAQSRYRVIRTENFRREPAGTASLLATVNAGIELAAEGVDGRWVQVVLEGWVWARSVDSTDREGLDLQVTARSGENLRSAPNGSIVARLSSGALLEELDRRPGWVRVRRVGWMFGPSLEQLGLPAPTRPAAAAAPAPAAAPPAAGSVLDHATASAATALLLTPGGDTTGILEPGSRVRIVARSGDWVRVQTEGWVRADDLQEVVPGVLVGVSGAEVRADPGEYVGKVVRWTVQFIAVQSPDEIRRDIPEGSRYMLARGPLPETGFVYVVLTDEQADQLERTEPLSELEIVGQIRTGRSHYLGNPVLTLVEVARRRPERERP